MNIVPTNISYNSNLLKQNIISLHKLYPFIQVTSIGNSVLSNNIFAIKLGKGKRKVFYSGSFHANEWITSVLLMHFIEEYCRSYIANSSILGYSITKLFESTSIYIVPMVNPDGVDLVTGYIPKDSSQYKQAKKIATNFANISFPSRLEIKYNSALI